MKITICKSYKFEYSHHIYNQKKTESNPDTKCRNLHGHSGVVKIYITKDKLDECGMIVDFTNLKPIKDYINNLFDHVLIVGSDDEDLMKAIQGMGFCRWLRIEGNASSENIASYMFTDIEDILKTIDTELVLTRLEFSETDNNVVIIER